MRVFDAHEDIWTHVALKRAQGENDVFKAYHLENHLKGNVKGGIFVIWVEPKYEDAKSRLDEIVSAMKIEIAQASDFMSVVTTAKAYHEAIDAGKMGTFIGLEGLRFIQDDLTELDRLYELGARHAMLTWNEENALATGAKGSPDRGLTALGIEAIKKMNDKKMLVDVSHLNEKSFWDVMNVQSLPLMASHSNARSLCDHPRNLTDDQLRAIRDIGGVVGINTYPGFVGPKGTVDELVDHVIYMVEKMGIDHVGCGFDFCDYLKDDTMLEVLDGLSDHSYVPHLFEKLKKRGFDETSLHRIAYRNFERLLTIL